MSIHPLKNLKWKYIYPSTVFNGSRLFSTSANAAHTLKVGDRVCVTVDSHRWAATIQSVDQIRGVMVNFDVWDERWHQWMDPATDCIESHEGAKKTSTPLPEISKSSEQLVTIDSTDLNSRNVGPDIADHKESSVPNESTEFGVGNHWQAYTTDEGLQYFYNTETKLTQWERPSEFLTIVSSSVSEGCQRDPDVDRAPDDSVISAIPNSMDKKLEWKTYTTADGVPYYYNTVTGLTQWDNPLEENSSYVPDPKGVVHSGIEGVLDQKPKQNKDFAEEMKPEEGTKDESDTSDVWEVYSTEGGEIYYYNTKTRASQWEKPKKNIHELENGRITERRATNGDTPERTVTSSIDQSLTTNSDRPSGDTDSEWKRYETDTGDEYFHNKKTGMTQWKSPFKCLG